MSTPSSLIDGLVFYGARNIDCVQQRKPLDFLYRTQPMHYGFNVHADSPP